MICRTRSGSASAHGRARWGSAPRAASRGRRPRGRTPGRPRERARRGRRPAARPPSRRRRAWRGRGGRSVSFVSRSTCSRMVWTNSARASGSGSSSSSSSTKPPREKIGVRSSCEALAMNSLRALSRSREAPLHLVEGPRELAELVGGVDRDRGAKSPSATFCAALLQPPQAARVRPRGEEAGDQGERERDGARDQDLALDQGDVVVDLVRAARRAPRSRSGPRAGSAGRRSAELVAPDRLDPGRDLARRRPGRASR